MSCENVMLGTHTGYGWSDNIKKADTQSLKRGWWSSSCTISFGLSEAEIARCDVKMMMICTSAADVLCMPYVAHSLSCPGHYMHRSLTPGSLISILDRDTPSLSVKNTPTGVVSLVDFTTLPLPYIACTKELGSVGQVSSNPRQQLALFLTPTGPPFSML